MAILAVKDVASINNTKPNANQKNTIQSEERGGVESTLTWTCYMHQIKSVALLCLFQYYRHGPIELNAVANLIWRAITNHRN